MVHYSQYHNHFESFCYYPGMMKVGNACPPCYPFVRVLVVSIATQCIYTLAVDRTEDAVGQEKRWEETRKA